MWAAFRRAYSVVSVVSPLWCALGSHSVSIYTKKMFNNATATTDHWLQRMTIAKADIVELNRSAWPRPLDQDHRYRQDFDMFVPIDAFNSIQFNDILCNIRWPFWFVSSARSILVEMIAWILGFWGFSLIRSNRSIVNWPSIHRIIYCISCDPQKNHFQSNFIVFSEIFPRRNNIPFFHRRSVQWIALFTSLALMSHTTLWLCRVSTACSRKKLSLQR